VFILKKALEISKNMNLKTL